MVAQISVPPVFDRKFITACIEGDLHLQRQLYNSFSPTMFGICLRYSADYHSAEDILQEGFIKVFSRLDGFRHEGSFEGWMKRIFVNTAIEYYRKGLKFNQLSDLEVVQDFVAEDDAFQNLLAKDLLMLIQKLPTGYRTIFNLYAIEGYSHREISELLNISVGTSKSQLARARLALQKKVRMFYPELV